MSPCARQRGFTLVELLITVVVLAILASLAAPSFADLIDRRRLASQTEAVMDLLHLARSEAIKHSGVALPRTVSVTVSPGATWFVGAANGNAACSTMATCVLNEGGTNVSRFVTNKECAGCTVTSPTAAETYVFSFRGLLEAGVANTPIVLTSPRGHTTQITVSQIGRVAVCSSGVVGSYPIC